jgi:hypothetical protein
VPPETRERPGGKAGALGSIGLGTNNWEGTPTRRLSLDEALEQLAGRPSLGAVRKARGMGPATRTPPAAQPPRDNLEAETRALILERLAAREGREDEHRDRLVREGHRLGRLVATHRVTMADAGGRLGRMVGALDPELAYPTFLVPPIEGLALAVAALEARIASC